jgi:thioredoxin 1
MTDDLRPIGSIDALDAALLESFSRPVLILKHSRACGVSAQAFDEVKNWLAGRPLDGPSYLVTVQTHRDIARAIADRLGVRHESPQALIVRDGRVTWHASHFRVTPGDIEKALS